MKNLIAILIIVLTASFWTAASVQATELVYTPINPSFGGNPLNSSFLLSIAEAQKDFKEDVDVQEDSILDDFQDSLTRQILSELSRRIVDTAFGDYDDELSGGTYHFGNYDISIDTLGATIDVTILDVVTGESTTVEVPYY